MQKLNRLVNTHCMTLIDDYIMSSESTQTYNLSAFNHMVLYNMS